jgi:hypothetical protein
VERVGGNSRKYSWIVQLPFFRAVTVAVAIRARDPKDVFGVWISLCIAQICCGIGVCESLPRIVSLWLARVYCSGRRMFGFLAEPSKLDEEGCLGAIVMVVGFEVRRL